jgi:hypothetical protein
MRRSRAPSTPTHPRRNQSDAGGRLRRYRILQHHRVGFPEQRDEEVRHQLEALENQCQSALSDRAEED